MGSTGPDDVCPGSSKHLSGVFRAWHTATAGRMAPYSSGGGSSAREYLPVPGSMGNNDGGQLAPGMAIPPAGDPHAPNPRGAPASSAELALYLSGKNLA